MKQVTTIIKNCVDCPHVDHTGAFTKGGAKPVCGHLDIIKEKGHNCFDRVIPYKTVYREDGRTFRTPKRIPDWCPL